VAQEIDLSRYVRVIWHRKWLIALGAVLPAVAVGVALSLSPVEQLSESSYNISLSVNMFDRVRRVFYSADTLDVICARLKEKGYENYSLKLRQSVRNGGEIGFRYLVAMSAYPKYPDPETMGIRDPKQIETWREMKHDTIVLTTRVPEGEAGLEIALLVREVFETILPLHLFIQTFQHRGLELRDELQTLGESIVAARDFLNTSESRIATLRTISSNTADRALTEDPVLIAAVVQDDRFLPLNYQIEAAEIERAQRMTNLQQFQRQYQTVTKQLTLQDLVCEGIRDGNIRTIGECKAYLNQLRSGQSEDSMEQYNQEHLAHWLVLADSLMWDGFRLADQPSIYRFAVEKAFFSLVTFGACLFAMIGIVVGIEALKL